MRQRSALLFCDADQQKGMGHLVRSLSLAEQARERGWQVCVAGVFGGRALEHAAALAPNQQVVALGSERASEELHALLSACDADVLHLDSYDATLDVRIPAHTLVSNMQDGLFGRRPADLHIDANLDAELLYRRFTEGERAIIGVSGVQIRGAFRSLEHSVRDCLSAPFEVLVLLGGSDSTGLLPRLVRTLAAHDVMRLSVICRPEAQVALEEHLGEYAEQIKLLPFTDDLPGLAGMMDAVITASGTSVWDFAAAGIPMGVIAVVDNQLHGYRACEAHGMGFPLGEPPHDDLDERVAGFVAFLQDMQRVNRQVNVGRNVVDGLGSWRVVSAWEELVDMQQRVRYEEKALQVPDLVARAATLEDAQQLFEWRNDEATRTASRSRARVPWEDHTAWLTGVLDDPNRKLLVIEESSEPVGSVRWDRLGEQSWEVSITLAPSHRGRGLASAVLYAGERVFQEQVTTQVFAAIHVSNTASKRLFQRAGYLPYMPGDESGFERRAKWLFAK